MSIKLQKKAGFVFWEDEEHGPGPNNIDWASDYTEELKKYTKLVEKETLKKLANNDVKMNKKFQKIMNKKMKKSEKSD